MRLRLAIILTLLAAPALAQQADPPPATQPPPAPVRQPPPLTQDQKIILELRRKCEGAEYTATLLKLQADTLAEELKKLKEAQK